MSLCDCEAFGSMDWGWNSPGVHLWWICLPDGRYHVAREFKFQAQTAEQVGKAIHDETKALGLQRLRYIACDPAMWQKTGAGRGESIAETLLRLRLPVRKSDNDRFLGWLRVHEMLRDHPDGDGPFLTIDPSCKYLIRTLPAMVQDKNDPDDLDSSKDDHAVDALRYGAMSRPSPTRIVTDQAAPVNSWAWWRKHHEASNGVGVNA